ncbi:endonuclease VII domain-containing protein [Streptomyces sp. NPDC000594]|uniref:endonuclease VII domain-containing protein n=1 Tax=Streptomyces sp. NPDC000594 TaxID=3154261 RepID=UPI00332483DD
MTARKGYRRCTRCERGRAERFFAPRGKVCAACKKTARSEAAHDARVQATYGLRPGEYSQLFQRQNGRCAICGETRRQRLSVDHCHRTLLVRGLLCRMCNGRLLTSARDRPAVLRSAARYLEDPPAPHLIGWRYYQGKK